MIAGTGIDLVDVARMKKILSRWGDRFPERFFSPHECAYCREKASPAIHYAARFAAKESFLKSVGIGLGAGISLKDIEVRNNAQGKPDLILHDQALQIIAERGVGKIHLSLTHTTAYAAAMVILET